MKLGDKLTRLRYVTANQSLKLWSYTYESKRGLVFLSSMKNYSSKLIVLYPGPSQFFMLHAEKQEALGVGVIRRIIIAII